MVPMATRDELVVQRFKTALDLFELGEAMLRQRLRRKFPQASEADIDTQVQAWLERRPGAEHGDGVGRPAEWPRGSTSQDLKKVLQEVSLSEETLDATDSRVASRRSKP